MANPFKNITLGLTSPHKTGQVVKDAQAVLTKNRFGTDFLKNPIDGDFGPVTASACHTAKFWLGYPFKQCTPTFGEVLYGLLVPTTSPDFIKLPRLYQLRRAWRIKKANEITFRQKAVKLAHTFQGYTENPAGSNDTIFGAWYGMNGEPWCAMFVSYCLSHSGYSFKESYVPTIVALARASQQRLSVTWSPIQGDLVCYDWNNDGTFDHVGFFDHWVDEAAGTFATVEGNTTAPGGSGDPSNGGGVFAEERGTKQGYTVVFVRAV